MERDGFLEEKEWERAEREGLGRGRKELGKEREGEDNLGEKKEGFEERIAAEAAEEAIITSRFLGPSFFFSASQSLTVS